MGFKVGMGRHASYLDDLKEEAAHRMSLGGCRRDTQVLSSPVKWPHSPDQVYVATLSNSAYMEGKEDVKNIPFILKAHI